MLTLDDLQQEPQQLFFSSATGEEMKVHMFPSWCCYSKYLEAYCSHRWPRRNPINLPEGISIRAVSDILLFIANRYPPFKPEEDADRLAEYMQASNFLQCHDMPIHPKFLYDRIPQCHPTLLLRRPRPGQGELNTPIGWKVISSRHYSSLGRSPTGYGAATVSSKPQRGFKLVVELLGLWSKADKLLLGGLPHSKSVSDHLDEPAGLWFSVSSGRLLLDGKNLVKGPLLHACPLKGRKPAGSHWGFELREDGHVQVGVPSSGSKIQWIPTDYVHSDCNLMPGLLLQPHVRQNYSAAEVLIKEVTNASDRDCPDDDGVTPH